MPLYLDNAATTHICKEVLDEMIKSLDNFGNSESKFYSYAEDAKKDISLARERIATAVGCDKEEVVFTSGATEANNLFIKGLALAHPEKKKIIISSIEHSSIYETCKYLESNGYNLVEIPVDNKGLIDLDVLDKLLDDNTLFVSIIWVNNEIGTIQNIKMIDDICSKHKVLFHSDATQAFGKVRINMSEYKALKLLTFTSHKIYGPKGIGTLIVRKEDGVKLKLVPLFHGGEQENNYRAGTLSNELIVGFGKACELMNDNFEDNHYKIINLEKRLIELLREKFTDKLIINNDFNERVSGIINVQIKGITNMVLLKKLAPYIAASTGSACGISKPSRVLKAIGLSDNEINCSIRLSLSHYQNENDYDIIQKI
mgnify:CR=1 FL=1